MGKAKLLVTAQELADRIDQQGWVVVDCRFDLADTGRGEAAYREVHIPGARYAHLDHDLSGPVTAATGRHPLPDVSRFREWLGSQGIDKQTQVVAYDDAGGSMAVRLWWLLRWLGHDRAALLDGGLQSWTAAGLSLSAEITQPLPTKFFGEEDASMVTETEEIPRLSPRQLVIDVRTSERFRGEAEPIDPVAGHIPGAVNVPWPQNFDASGCFLLPNRLRELYERATGTAVDERILMCGSGVTGCLGVFALEIAGIRGARLYAGSWSEWIRDPHRPVAVGAA